MFQPHKSPPLAAYSTKHNRSNLALDSPNKRGMRETKGAIPVPSKEFGVPSFLDLLLSFFSCGF